MHLQNFHASRDIRLLPPWSTIILCTYINIYSYRNNPERTLATFLSPLLRANQLQCIQNHIDIRAHSFVYPDSRLLNQPQHSPWFKNSLQKSPRNRNLGCIDPVAIVFFPPRSWMTHAPANDPSRKAGVEFCVCVCLADVRRNWYLNDISMISSSS